MIKKRRRGVGLNNLFFDVVVVVDVVVVAAVVVVAIDNFISKLFLHSCFHLVVIRKNPNWLKY